MFIKHTITSNEANKTEKTMGIDDLLEKLARGQNNLRDPDVWQKHCEKLFPDTAFIITVENGKVKTTGLSIDQQRILQREIVKTLGL